MLSAPRAKGPSHADGGRLGCGDARPDPQADPRAQRGAQGTDLVARWNFDWTAKDVSEELADEFAPRDPTGQAHLAKRLAWANQFFDMGPMREGDALHHRPQQRPAVMPRLKPDPATGS